MNEKQVRRLLKEVNLTWAEFDVFMYGQTVGINDDDSIDYYDRDVNNFLRYHAKDKVSLDELFEIIKRGKK